MSGTSYELPTFTENDSTNWMAFKNMVIMAAEVQGAISYLEGTIKDPTTLIKPANTTNSKITSTTTTKSKNHTINAIFWDFNELTASEWRVRNAWSKELSLCNIWSPIRLRAEL